MDATLVFDEYLTPHYVTLPLTGAYSLDTLRREVRMTDESTGLPVALTGDQVVLADGEYRAIPPQLPTGTFRLSHPEGSVAIVVSGPGGIGEYGADDASTNRQLLWLLSLSIAIVAGVLYVASRKRLMAGALAVTSLVVAGGTFFDRSEESSNLSNDWRNCRIAATDFASRRNCEIAHTTRYLLAGELVEEVETLASTGDPTLLADCHATLHEVGYRLWRTYRSVDTLPYTLVSWCDGALLHGVVESMGTFESDTDFLQLVDEYCQSTSDTAAREHCYHGSGHATISRTNANLYAAFELCGQIPRERFQGSRYNCHGSAVMEWSERWGRLRKIASPGTGVAKIAPNPDDPMTVCTEPGIKMLLGDFHDATYSGGCYLGTNFRSGDALSAASRCNELESSADYCFYALGANLLFFTSTKGMSPLTIGDVLEHVEACRTADNHEAALTCVQQSAKVYTSVRLSQNQGERLCQELTGSVSAACRRGVADAAAFLRVGDLSIR